MILESWNKNAGMKTAIMKTKTKHDDKDDDSNKDQDTDEDEVGEVNDQGASKPCHL